ncbi:MAG TPA: hypothetical protein VNN07_14655 [Candidatus Tectomicrobia bacterium]|nr:hypothetical protein [Candidatus Tectomicrobia bacterium]
MLADLTKSVRTLAVERRQLNDKEKQLVAALNRLLPQLGYQVVAANGAGRAGGKQAARIPKRLECPKCDRRFALPAHLGRHMAASHRAKRAPNKKRKAA